MRQTFPESTAAAANSDRRRDYMNGNNGERGWARPEGAGHYEERRGAPSGYRGEPGRRNSALGGRLILFLVLFLLLAGICAALFAVYFFSTPDKIGSSMKYTYGRESVRVSEKNAYRGGKLYVSFSRIADMALMSKTGDSTEMRFILADGASDSAGTGNEEYVSFKANDADCTVSGTKIRLSGDCVFSSGEVFVPADFVTEYMDGITVEADSAKRTVKISRNKTEETDADGKFTDAAVTFTLKASLAPSKLSGNNTSDTAGTGNVKKDIEVTFATDLSEYEKYMTADSDEYLVLVNRQNTVDASLSPSDLVDVRDTRSDRSARKMREYAEKSLEAMFNEMRAAGYTDVSVTSAYRSYDEQKNLYAGYVTSEMSRDPSLTEEAARAVVDTYSAREGTSEHQTGLCCDMHNLPGADQAFANEAVYSWLEENAWKFGFTERFPKNKTEITGYSYEPWHWRFVGRAAAYDMKQRGMCLEEYVEYKNK